jgi:hypothetical protein
MRRAIQRFIEDPLSELVLRGKFQSGSTIRVTKRGEEMGFEMVRPDEAVPEEGEDLPPSPEETGSLAGGSETTGP